MRTVRFRLNGGAVTAEIPDHRLLVELLQDHFLLMGCRESCGQGVCGTCTVLLDGDPVSACLLLAAEVDGHEVTTVEGLAAPGPHSQADVGQSRGDAAAGLPAAAGPPAGALHPVLEAFLRHFAFQCGYCTPGMMLTVLAYLHEDAPISAEKYLRGNLCRCGCYAEILNVIAALR